MIVDQLSEHLMRLEIFQDLPPKHIAEIVRRAERVIYKPGQALIIDGEAGDAAIIPIAGEAVRTAGAIGGGLEEHIEPGSLIGEMAMLIDTDYSSTIVARTSVKALRIARSDITALMEVDPALAEHFVQKVAGRLNRLVAELRDVDTMLAADAAAVDDDEDGDASYGAGRSGEVGNAADAATATH